VRLFAPAKINLGLSITRRLESGYHTLESLFVPLSVGDELEVSPSDKLSLKVVGADLPTDRRNLVYRAAETFFEESSVPGGVKIRLYKNLPLASGLGGGSSDAAITLWTLERMYGPTELDLSRLALSLGADVPFFLLEQSAFVTGIGEVLTPVRVPKTHLVLANSGLEVSAKEAYTWLDESGGFTGKLPLEDILRALENQTPVPYFNALQASVLAHHPELEGVLAALEGVGLHSPLMSGSGSTCFALAKSELEAQEAAQRLGERYPGWWVRAAHTLTHFTPHL
jgi:4-diphosphocytidyl-2-C-methyl-D-erythritol kinase